MRTRVAIYVRCSTSMQDLGVQIHDLTAYAQARDFEVTGIFEEFAVSGTKRTRPKLDEMMKLARQRKFDILLIWRLDRLGRSTTHLLNLIDELESLGIKFISYQENFDFSTSMGRVMATIMAALSNFEKDLLKERVRAGLEHARRKGVVLGRPASVDVEEVKRLRSSGLSYRAISRETGISIASISKALKVG